MVPTSSIDLLFRAGAETEAELHMLHGLQGEVLVVRGFGFDEIQPQRDSRAMVVAPEKCQGNGFEVMATFCRTIAANRSYTDNRMQAESVIQRGLERLIHMVAFYFQYGFIDWFVRGMKTTDVRVHDHVLHLLNEWSSLGIKAGL